MRFILLTTAVFAAQTAAQITTTIWYVGNNPDPEANLPITASVAGFDGSRTTIVLAETGATTQRTTQSTSPETSIVIGDTYASFYVVAYDNFDAHTTMTIDAECSRANTDISANATCTFSTRGAAESLRANCDKYSKSVITTEVYTVTRPARSGRTDYETLWTATETRDYRSSSPSYCSGSAIPKEELTRTETFPGGSDEMRVMTTYELVLTAGLEKLNAAATPTEKSSPASSASIGGAAPLKTAVPALVGMGAAVAAMFL